MPPATQNPFVALAWILAVLIGIPGFVALVKLIFFVADASKDLKTVVRYVHDRRSIEQSVEITLTLVENDITALQEHVNLPTHPWPDRRIGPSDRRAS